MNEATLKHAQTAIDRAKRPYEITREPNAYELDGGMLPLFPELKK